MLLFLEYDGSLFQEAYVKALGRGFSAAPFKTFTIRSRAASKGGSHVSETLDSEVWYQTSNDSQCRTSMVYI